MTPLVRKLGLKPGQRVAFLNAPAGYRVLVAPLPSGLLEAAPTDADLDFVQFFAPDTATLRTEWPRLKARLAKDGMLWICWPKKASKLPTDLTREVVRQIGLSGGLVDVKVCAIVYRTKDR